MEQQRCGVPEKMKALAREFEACRQVFTALGDENRQRIMIALLEHHGGMRVGALTERTNLSRPAVSHHLKILKDAGIVTMFKRGTMNFYHVDADESHWGQLASLFHQVNEVVQEVTDRWRQGHGCCQIDGEAEEKF